MRVLALHPSQNFTTVAVWSAENIYKKTLSHDIALTQATQSVLDWLNDLRIPLDSLALVLIDDLVNDSLGKIEYVDFLIHELGLPVVTVQTRTPTELWPMAKLTGSSDIPRVVEGPVAAIEFVAQKLCPAAPEHTNQLVIAHIDEEIAIAAVVDGLVTDMSIPANEGPFSLNSAGGLPFNSVLELCLELNDQAAVQSLVSSESGLASYLGCNTFCEAEGLSDQDSKLIFEALIYQIAKEIVAYTVAMKGKLSTIVLTGAWAKSERLVNGIQEYINFLAPVIVYPNNYEVEGLIHAGLNKIPPELRKGRLK